MKNEYKYLISVVMPLYKVAQYLEEAIDSVVAQTIGFRDNIQLILVNDGSPDDVDVICQKYKSLYPDNVIYIEQTNKGLPAARNAGLEFVGGKYLNFFDGDDRWDPEAFSRMYDFFEKNYDKIDFLAARYCFFGRREGFSHPLDFKFTSTRIIDINTDYNCVQLSAATALFKASAMIKQRFDNRLLVSEDSILMTQVLLDKMAYGVVKEAVYYYRKRHEANSNVDLSSKMPEWYFDVPRYGYKKIFDESLKRTGEIIPYAQYLVMYDLQWRLDKQMPDNFNESERQEYESLIVELLNDIDDRIIMEQKYIGQALRLFVLSLKYKTDVSDSIQIDDGKLYYHSTYLFSLRGKSILRVTNVKIRNNVLYLEGISQVHMCGAKSSLKLVSSDGKEVPVEVYPIASEDRYAFTGEKILVGRGFRASVELGGLDWIRFYWDNGNGENTVLSPTFIRNAKIDNTQKNSYYSHGKYIIKRQFGGIKIIKRNGIRALLEELRYLKSSVLPDRKYKLAFLRIVSLINRRIFKKPIWLVSDRTNMARDNGEALFSYLMQQKNNQRRIYFVLDKDSVDYRRMKKIGKVLKIGSLRYKLYFLQAEKIISSHADDWVINAFGKDGDIMKNLYDFDYVFLQNGIIKHDLSKWLHKTKKDIALFITSAEREYKSIIEGDYGYTQNEVILTGLPRYDKLESKPIKKIVILPTWRKNITGPVIDEGSVRDYSDTFKNTDYFEFYNSLINDEKLIDAMRKHGFNGEFYVHPSFSSQAIDFSGNDAITVVKEEADYNKLFRESALMVTDFSSVAFDFAYLKKPIIYSQFDRETFFEGHLYDEGYYSDEEDGFGPVCYTYKDTLDEIIRYIENGCKLKPKYEQRIDEFFFRTDKKNCERVYQCILNHSFKRNQSHQNES